MSNGLENARSVVIVFVMDGCPACDDYKPRFWRQIEAFQAHGQPLVIYDLGMPIMPGQIPVVILDGASEDDSVVDIAERHDIQAMPTTLLLSRSGRPVKIEGAVEDREIYNALVTACLANH